MKSLKRLGLSLRQSGLEFMTKATSDVRPKILLTRKLPTVVENRLRSDYDVTLNATDRPMTIGGLSAAMSSFDALVSTVSDPLDATVLQARLFYPYEYEKVTTSYYPVRALSSLFQGGGIFFFSF